MVRELAISIYLTLFWIIFNLCKLCPQKKKTVGVASFGDNIFYAVRAIRKLSDEEIVILKDASCRYKFDESVSRVVPFTLRNPISYIISIYHLATATTVLVDTYHGFLAATKFRQGTTCIQLWHAAGAIKKFGLEDPSNRFRSKKAMERFRKVYNSFDYTVVGSEKMANVFRQSFGLTEDRILRTGVPRTDFFYHDEEKLRVYRRLKNKFPNIAGKKVILYAPTYRNDQLDQFRLELDIELFRQKLSEEYVLFIKLHPAVAGAVNIAADDPFVYDVSKRRIQGLMLLADILITDYSSIPFEFSLLEKPMIFFAYDMEEYKKDSGLIENYLEEMPGPVVSTSEELVAVIEKGNFDMERVRQFKQEWNKYSKGSSSMQLARAILGQEETKEKHVLMF